MNEINIDITGNNVRIHEWGNNDNPTIICLHGLGSTSLSFLELGEALKNKYHIYSIDLPGHGETSTFESDEEYEIPNLVLWVDKVIKTLQKDSFFLLAHSWGGDITLHYAARYPEKVIKLLLLDGGYYIKDRLYSIASNLYDEGKLKGRSSCSLEEEIEYYIKDFDEYVFDTWEDFIKVEKGAYMKWSPLKEVSSRDLMKKEDGKQKFRASGNTARRAILSMSKNPTKEIWDNLSNNILLLQSTLPESWLNIRNTLSNEFRQETNAKVKKIDNTTHMLHWDKPEIIVKEIINWFK
ncbi:alpha/beta hydrolase [Clostridium sp. D2Q-11]|uniref:Alpha/beta hydrolase n=1 Tax=Anaeromonas frigoriresistens TaxID=2683708 RepID=A0A942UZ13_9FIRM|nr:alpha/beta hydrolase [Anaeromonas frigoriresistens]MBS4538921.1 alpha/beta hydrolase [Anaeromonas frigoriresistens]